MKRWWQRFKKYRSVRFIWKSRLTRYAFLGLVIFYLVAFIGPLFAPYDPITTNLDQAFLPFSTEHFFGTDDLGRDVFSRILFGMRTLAIVSFGVFVLGGWFFTVILALLAGYYGGWRDSAILRIGEVLGSIPPLIFLIIVRVSFGDRFEQFMLKVTEFTGITWLVESGITQIFLILLALSLIAWVGGVYVLRSRVLQEREQGYVESLRVLGASNKRILFYHILPNVMGLIVLSLSSILIGAIGAEIALSFLGLGVQDPYPSFGIMFYQVADIGLLRNHPSLLIIPGVIVFYIGILSWIFGDQLGRIIESKKSNI